MLDFRVASLLVYLWLNGLKLVPCGSDESSSRSISYDPYKKKLPLKMYINEFAPASRTAQLCMESLNIKIKWEKIDVFKGEHLSKKFTAINPLQTVPVVKDNNVILTDSHAICIYLITKYGTKKDIEKFYPKNTTVRAKIHERMFYAATFLQPLFGKIFYNLAFESEKGIRSDYLEELNKRLGQIERMLAHQNWIAGEKLTIADFAFAPYVSSWQGTPSFSKYTNVNRYLNKCRTKIKNIDEVHSPGKKPKKLKKKHNKAKRSKQESKEISDKKIVKTNLTSTSKELNRGKKPKGLKKNSTISKRSETKSKKKSVTKIVKTNQTNAGEELKKGKKSKVLNKNSTISKRSETKSKKKCDKKFVKTNLTNTAEELNQGIKSKRPTSKSKVEESDSRSWVVPSKYDTSGSSLHDSDITGIEWAMGKKRTFPPSQSISGLSDSDGPSIRKVLKEKMNSIDTDSSSSKDPSSKSSSVDHSSKSSSDDHSSKSSSNSDVHSSKSSSDWSNTNYDDSSSKSSSNDHSSKSSSDWSNTNNDDSSSKSSSDWSNTNNDDSSSKSSSNDHSSKSSSHWSNTNYDDSSSKSSSDDHSPKSSTFVYNG